MYFYRVVAWLMTCVCVCVCARARVCVYECALLERWVYVLCCVSYLSFVLPMDEPRLYYSRCGLTESMALGQMVLA